MTEHGSDEQEGEGMVDNVFNDVLERTTHEVEPECDRDRAGTVQLEEQAVKHPRQHHRHQIIVNIERIPQEGSV